MIEAFDQRFHKQIPHLRCNPKTIKMMIEDPEGMRFSFSWDSLGALEKPS